MDRLSYFTIRAEIKALKQNHTYAYLSKKYGVNNYYLWNIINVRGYRPPDKVLLKLGCTVTKPAPVCRKCGAVHVTTRCTAKARQYRDLWAMPTKVLRWKLENRKEVQA